uniref:(northern house mosquito) hypothetical protein n=1 Tax=Culex pipiens TaxID=7175 RepID=A0A8D8J9C3_CULPI
MKLKRSTKAEVSYPSSTIHIVYFHQDYDGAAAKQTDELPRPLECSPEKQRSRIARQHRRNIHNGGSTIFFDDDTVLIDECEFCLRPSNSWGFPGDLSWPRAGSRKSRAS